MVAVQSFSPSLAATHSGVVRPHKLEETIKGSSDWLLSARLYSLFGQACPIEHSISCPALRVVLHVSWLWPVDMCLLRPPLRRQAAWGPCPDQALLMGPEDPT